MGRGLEGDYFDAEDSIRPVKQVRQTDTRVSNIAKHSIIEPERILCFYRRQTIPVEMP